MVIVTKSSSSSLSYSAQSEMSYQSSFPHLSCCFYRVWIIVKQAIALLCGGVFFVIPVCSQSVSCLQGRAMTYKHGHSTVSECDVECTQCITWCLSWCKCLHWFSFKQPNPLRIPILRVMRFVITEFYISLQRGVLHPFATFSRWGWCIYCYFSVTPH